MKCLVIDAKDQAVYESELVPRQLRRLIGGPPTLVHTYPSGDELYCNDIGLAVNHHFCWLPATPRHVYGGRLVLLGPDRSLTLRRAPHAFVRWEPETFAWPGGQAPTNADPSLTVAQLAHGIRWMTLEEAKAFGEEQARASIHDPKLPVD
ncbi:MAG: hypothetical protein JOY66_07895 [Acetobacteraceae bacterium]|nr:hypothetical protein [Acetobacteraceae bacterium]